MKLATLMAAVAVVGLGGVATAADPAPTTQPVAATVQPVANKGKVLVLAFDATAGGAGRFDWIGRAVQQNLMTELGRVKALSPMAGTQTAADATAAVEAGRSAGADDVVFGSFQLVDQDLRINGQVVEVATGKMVGTLKSTGTVRDLFAMEDTVAQQVRRLLAPPVYQPADLPLAIPAPPVQQVQAPAPVQPAAPQGYASDYNRYTYYPSNVGYGYGYPGYGYGYGGYGYGACYPVTVNAGWVSVSRTVNRPIGVGTSAGMVASGMISVQGNFLPNGQLAK